METETGNGVKRIWILPRTASHVPRPLLLSFPVRQGDAAAAVTIGLVTGQSAAAEEHLLAAFDLELDR